MPQSNFKPRHKKSSVGRTFNPKKDIDKMYDHAWEKYRRKFLSINDQCYACGKPATVVDHLVPHKGDEFLFKKTDNHIPLCEKCHNTITSLFDRNYRPNDPITKKVEWLNRLRLSGLFEPKRVKVLPAYNID